MSVLHLGSVIFLAKKALGVTQGEGQEESDETGVAFWPVWSGHRRTAQSTSSLKSSQRTRPLVARSMVGQHLAGTGRMPTDI